ncbi:MAG TPA: GNAT family N-acetyltransferase, partial [Bacteroidales bacterium]|nr:GNAT family N-acetyltransferase [Bacteroidales bacterium]
LGAWPYQLKKKYGFRYILSPPFTQITGPVISFPEGQGLVKKQSYEKKVLDKLVGELPPFDWLQLEVDYNISNWQPFFWKNFNQTTRYTYVIDRPSLDFEELMNSFSKSARQEIRKAEKNIEVKSGLDIRSFYQLNQMSFNRQHLEMPISFEKTKRMIDACLQHDVAEILYASDPDGSVHAGLMVAWDKKYLYFLLGGGDPEFRTSGSKFMVTAQAILLAAQKGLSVNFRGSMIENIAYYDRQFGAYPLPYHQISKINSRMLRWKFFLFPEK